MRYLMAGLTAAALLCAGTAQAQPRLLEVPATASWQHARTGMIFPPRLAGLPREKINDFGTNEADVAATYKDENGTVASLYFFHAGIPSVPMWFDRSRAAIIARRDLGTFSAASPVPFAVKPGAPADGLRITYSLQGGLAQSTALAVIPVGQWLLAVRMTGEKLDAGALDARLTAVLAEIRWPADRTAGPVAAPIMACVTPRTFSKAKMLKPDMEQVLINSVLPNVAAERALPTYCRDRVADDAQWAVYQAEGTGDGYMLSIGDGGGSISVMPALLLGKGKQSYSVIRYGLTDRINYPNLSALPAPEQLLDILAHATPMSSVATLDAEKKNNITINSNAIRK